MKPKFYVEIYADRIELWFDNHEGEKTFQATYYFKDEYYVAKYVFDDIYRAKDLGYTIVQSYHLD